MSCTFDLHEVVPIDAGKKSIACQQLSFAPTPRYIVFKNHYAAFLAIKQLHLSDASISEEEWVTVYEKQLMQYPHFEDEAELEHKIDVLHFNESYVQSNDTESLKLQLVCSQPSTNWCNICLSDIQCFAASEELTSSDSKCDEIPQSKHIKPSSINTDPKSNTMDKKVANLAESWAAIKKLCETFKNISTSQ